ncbi:TPA: GDYXXLXY domain-containing protein [Aeromonas veronii]|uniref:GDYXXLXY domain-containing protein n=1 Tax=Aeromonas TaxID=642 RepID=UPI002AE06CEE|nr:GDYXXLXY domain-containing protein [Aeromonas allosaccharophila]HDO1318284.1 GDYXXLXY domain-containing protein [Aeromonas veronii]HDO1327418.1 GDYXXLXY domain-containing protein [Aeromonas veronii]HDO1331939.1 GDYXXLXY domain-containing protein [Aeromonas veronii]HDO1336680.1 GDYXXLXY domain-containing protein [Aeromonas veronii]HDO1341001.1 GDYXXLXY domain-containing protein [Aeromonas veronii]
MKPVTRQLALLLSGLAILAGINATVWRYEHAMSSGEVVLLRLAPVDPRSLMQGDYMRLNYEIARELTSRDARATQDKGSDTLVIRLDAHQVASLVADGKPDRLASDERLLQVHQSERQWQIGPDAYFFEEGTGEQYEAARYGEFRLQADGKTLLVGLRDEAYQPIGQTRARW